jgi:polyether ionophore transport system permease protein
LHRGLLAGWTAAFAALGVLFGSTAEGVGDMLRDNQNLRDFAVRMGGQATLVDAYLAAILSLVGLIAAAYAVQATLRLRAEEASGRAEPVLATAVGRLRWAASHLVFSVLGPTAALATAGLAAGLAYGLSTGNVGRQLPRVLAGAIVQLPAVWVLAAIAVALVGLLPRLTLVAWGPLGVCLLLGLVGTAVQLDQWLLDVSPYTHTPKLPGAAMSTGPLIWLAAAAGALVAAGLAGLHRRDIPAT